MATPTKLARKLQIRDHQAVVVLGAPEQVVDDLPWARSGAVEPAHLADAVIAFVRSRHDLGAAPARAAVAAARDDRLAWVAYPKAGQLGTDLNRDSLSEALRADDVRPVRQVSIDPVWSALRFRPV
jgi:hypothetical protein